MYILGDVTLTDLCSTAIPNLKYADPVDPNKSGVNKSGVNKSVAKSERKMNSPCTVVSVRLRRNRYCKRVEHFDFNLNQCFDSFVEKHDRNPTLEPLIVKPNIKLIEEENDMNSFIGISILYPFFERVSYINREPPDEKHKIEYKNITYGKPDFNVWCKNDEYLFIIEMKLDSKFNSGKRLIIILLIFTNINFTIFYFNKTRKT